MDQLTGLALVFLLKTAPIKKPHNRPVRQGMATYYGDPKHRRDGFCGRLTANGERMDAAAYTAASRTLPFNSFVRVTNTDNGRSVVVRINDRGPYSKKANIDLSWVAAQELGIMRKGRQTVVLEEIDG
jgi:rare lipoprotein A